MGILLVGMILHVAKPTSNNPNDHEILVFLEILQLVQLMSCHSLRSLAATDQTLMTFV